MKVVLCFFALITFVYSIPVIQEIPKKSVIKLSPVEVAEDNAGEEGVDLKPAEQFFIGYGGGGYGGYGGYGGGYGGYGGYGYRQHGWGGYGSYSRSSSSSEYWG